MTGAPDRDDTAVVGARVVAQVVDLFVIFVSFFAVLFLFGFSGGAVGALAGFGRRPSGLPRGASARCRRGCRLAPQNRNGEPPGLPLGLVLGRAEVVGRPVEVGFT